MEKEKNTDHHLKMQVISFKIPGDMKELVNDICKTNNITKSEFYRIHTIQTILKINSNDEK